jgi:hypothetical protein
MTAKDKAKELFDKYCHAIRTEEDDDGYFTNIIHAKRCALIAVNLHMEELSKMKLIFSDREIHYRFWENVKLEIEKL